MKNLNIKIGLSLLFGFGLISLQAQSTLYVKEKSGTQIPYILSSIRKITFSTGNMFVNKNDGSIATYSLSNIRYLSFKNLSIDIPQTEIINTNLQLFPNPVSEEFQIRYDLDVPVLMQIKIIDMQGKVVLHQLLNGVIGSNLFTINVSQLSQGLYICLVQNGSRFEKIKFIK